MEKQEGKTLVWLFFPPARGVKMLRAALTPDADLPNPVLPISPPQILRRLGVWKVKLPSAWARAMGRSLPRCSAPRPFCLLLLAHAPLSAADHTVPGPSGNGHKNKNPCEVSYVTPRSIPCFLQICI